MADSSGIDERVVSAQIGQFIMNSRIRVNDQNAQILFARNAYKSIAGNSRAFNELNNYFSANPPTENVHPVNIDITSIIPLTSETFQAEWTETATDSRGINSSTNYQGRYEIAISPPKDMVNLVNNPLGVYITDYYVQRKIR
jgi:type IV secretion system protein VirB5